jgi:hypothetical protein
MIGQGTGAPESMGNFLTEEQAFTSHGVLQAGSDTGGALKPQKGRQASYGDSQDAPLLTNGSRKCGIYTQWNFMQP